MPFSGYEDFDACVLDQQSKGHDPDSARRICGKLQAEAEGREDKGGTQTRLDFGVLGKAERTPSGGVRIPARLTRVGVLVYRRVDGTVVRELRPPDEVFHVDSLASLAGAPVTDLHPAEPVRPDNWKQLAVGHVGEEIKKDGDQFVAATLSIQDQNAIELIDRGERRDLSCGYSMRFDPTPGEWQGQRYDAIQRNIRYNHVGIGPSGWGRAGKDVALRFDGAAVEIEPGAEPDQKQGNQTMAMYRIDGVDYEVGSAAFMQALELYQRKQGEALAAEKQRADREQGRADAADKQVADLRKQLAEAQDPKRLDALVANRVALHTAARSVLGAQVKLDGKTDREVMIEVVQRSDSSFDPANRSDEYVRGRYEAVIKPGAPADQGGQGAGAVRQAAVQARKDAAQNDGAPDANAARARMVEDQRKAATEPLRFTRTG